MVKKHTTVTKEHITTPTPTTIAEEWEKTCEDGNLERVKQWMDDVQVQRHLIHVGFVRACIQGHLHLVQFMMQHNHNPKVQAIQRGFINACWYGHLDVVIFILKTCEIINKDEGLFIACHENRNAIAQYLLDQGAVVVNRTFSIVCRNGNDELVKMVASRCKTNQLLEGLNDLFLKRRFDLMSDIVNCLDVSEDDCHHGFAFACMGGNLSVVTCYLDTYSNINPFNLQTGVYHACMRNHVHLVAYFATMMNSTQFRNVTLGRNEFHVACANGSLEVVRFFLANEMIPLDALECGLVVAFANSHINVVQYLVETHNVQSTFNTQLDDDLNQHRWMIIELKQFIEFNKRRWTVTKKCIESKISSDIMNVIVRSYFTYSFP